VAAEARAAQRVSRRFSTAAAKDAVYASSASELRDVDEEGGDEADEDEAGVEEDGATTAAELDTEARELLQWPELSTQVRAFTSTTLGMRACTPFLPLGASPKESLRLLAETTAAVALRCSARGFARDVFEGARDVRSYIAGAALGRVLNGSALADIATTAAACVRVHRHVTDDQAGCDDGGDGKDNKIHLGGGGDDEASGTCPLTRLGEPLAAIPAGLAPEIRRCLAIPGGAVLDHASPALAAVRAERRDVEVDLRTLLTKKAAYMAQKNFAGEEIRILVYTLSPEP
jgi:DNA mismatch repair protein MutS2